MRLINGSRGSGKTTAIIEYAYKNSCIILCSSAVHKRIVIEKAKEMNLNIIEPILFVDYFRNFERLGLNFTKGQFPIVVDELDLCLRFFFNESIECATGTIPSIHPATYKIANQLECERTRIGNEKFGEEILGEWGLNTH